MRNHILLSKTKIKSLLSEKKFINNYKLSIFETINSTNDYLKQVSEKDDYFRICCSESQTNGKGRLGKKWHSPFGENIYCSFRLRATSNKHLPTLSLVTGLALISVLENIYHIHGLKLKWPNDILWNHKKLSGILIEIINTQVLDIIVGVGLNVNSDFTNDINSSLSSKYSWCSLYNITGNFYDRNLIISDLIIHIAKFISIFFKEGFKIFYSKWIKYDYLYNKKLQVKINSHCYSGMGKGINENGQLIIELKNGSKQSYSSGEVTIL